MREEEEDFERHFYHRHLDFENLNHSHEGSKNVKITLFNIDRYIITLILPSQHFDSNPLHAGFKCIQWVIFFNFKKMGNSNFQY